MSLIESEETIHGKVLCPVADRPIDGGDCVIICDVADRLIKPSVLPTDIKWSEDKREICKECKYHK